MKFLVLALFVCLVMIALVSAVPAEESLPGDLFDQDEQGRQNFFKLKKIKKLLLG
ncbi:PREDICTED: uncharacterized protein LOC108369697 [Rhagoletis zephyria]|uniref:uncharacterized protein LOC108369697 n=1 Tax=Rhagoletis zephyria TaxID=28612 RepID=UPI0008116A35|nr:PREDICTED: uncharacterized protein LOC108369697 [Rhagoletis zephyria]